MDKEQIISLNNQFLHALPVEILTYFTTYHKGKIILSSSMSAEDQVLLDMIRKIDTTVPVFTLDTGRIFPETYDLIAQTEKKFNTSIRMYFPNADDVEEMVLKHGINLFYNSIEKRKHCCYVRKQAPLQRALKDFDVWVCGLRKDQSVTRFSTEAVEWDETHQMIKINPLIQWTEEQVWNYIKTNDIPYNALHDKGYPSIGCQPCSRAIVAGEDVRAGRWWWEEPEHKECGLHNRPL